MSGRHALRLTGPRSRSIRRLYQAGDAGLAQLLSPDLSLLIEWGLAEKYTDPSRILTERIRLTDYGKRIASVLIYPLGE